MSTLQGTTSLIDPETIDYFYDEETNGFDEPVKQPESQKNPGQILSAGFMGVGVLSLIVYLFNDHPTGSWMGILLSFGLLTIAGMAYHWFSYKNTIPGIKHDGIMFSGSLHRGAIAWALGILFTGFYVVLYWWPEYLDRAIRLVDPLAMAMARQPADQWFLYGFLYTLTILIFGVRMFMKYRHNRYHQIRTASVMFFQLVLAFVIPQFLRALNEPEFYFTYFWPLKYDVLFPGTVDSLVTSPGALGTFMVFWTMAGSFVAVPVLTYFYGKRWYCSWVCGCGGLAETLGDPWRHLTPKTTLSWKIERLIIYSVLVLIILTTGVLRISNTAESGFLSEIAEPLKIWYGFYIGAVFAGVIGVGFYPLLGNRVWCRFGCPMAAVLGIIQRFFSRFRIMTNGDQCMSCGNCSTYCEMGIDVRAYAERGENIIRSSCVGCGICAAVCPRGVLKLENGATHQDRYPGSDKPLGAFTTAFKGARVYGDKEGYV